MDALLKSILEHTSAGKLDKDIAAQLIQHLKAVQSDRRTDNRDIAIIGISTRLPLAEDAEQFWELLKAETDFVRPFPDRRQQDYLNYKAALNEAEHSDIRFKEGAYLEEVDTFDHPFFRMSPAEANMTDPHQRIFLQTAWKAIEDAGYGGNRLSGTKTGVYVGYSPPEIPYSRMIEQSNPEELHMSFVGNIQAMIASRIAYLLDFKGPTLTVDTACSSSLVAVHMACKAIQTGDCDQAIAGSVNVYWGLPEREVRIGIESSNGRTQAFDDGSDGTGEGEGSIAIVLKPLKRALADGDSIYAVIKGSALNQDGRSIGITAPNAAAQSDVIAAAWKDADVDPQTITYIEAHGTGTKLGDPVEIEGISSAFERFTGRRQFCALGALKSNIGHLNSAAGIAGLVKAALALKNKQLPPNLHFRIPNREITFERSPVYVLDRLTEWKTEGTPRRCGVSSFGLSGTNCHMVMEEAPVVRRATGPGANTTELFTISARSLQSLKEMISNFRRYIHKNWGEMPNLRDVCYTQNTGRGHYDYRLAFIVTSLEDWQEKIDSLCTSDLTRMTRSDIYYGERTARGAKPNRTDPIEFEEEELHRLPLSQIGRLYVSGAKVDFDRLYPSGGCRRVNLPAYSFERIRCWVTWPETADKDDRPVAVKLQGDVAAFTQTERKLAQLWGEMFGVATMDREDDFFVLGGDSLIAGLMLSRVQKEFGVDLLLNQVFANPTLRMLAREIDHTDPISCAEIRPATIQSYYPTTPAQRRMYILERKSRDLTSYNIPVVHTINERIDYARFAEAMRQLTQRHEAFRTSFHWVEGELMQHIRPEVPIELEFGNVTEDELPDKIRAFVKPFDLGSAPLFRVELLKMSEDKHILLMDMHHSISDGFSLRVLLDELRLLYAGENLSPLRVQYKDYAVWLKEQGDTLSMHRQAKYWETVMAGELPVLRMPLDFARPTKQTFAGNTIHFTISNEMTDKLKLFAKNNDATLNSVLFAVYSALLHAYSGQNDLIIGTIVAGRLQVELERVIGMFANFLPIRLNVKEGTTLAEHVADVQRSLIDAYDHQMYPFDELVEKLGANQDASRNPIYDTLFLFHNELGSDDDAVEHRLDIQDVQWQHDVATVDFKLDVHLEEDRLACNLQYNTALFKPESMERFAERFQQLTAILLERPNEPDWAIPFLPDQTMKQQRSIDEASCVAVAATFTAESLEPYIHWWLNQFQLEMQVKIAPYNQIFQQLLDPDSLLSVNRGANVLLLRMEDWIRDDTATDAQQCSKLEQTYREWLNMFNHRQMNATWFVGIFPVSTHLGLSEDVIRCIESLNNRWLDAIEQMDGVIAVDLREASSLYQVRSVFDENKDAKGHLPFTTEYEAVTGTLIARRLIAWKRQHFKVIVLDCDHTLWQGVCGEDGPLGVRVEDPYRELQRFVIQKQREGMLIALCSKNTEQDVWDTFENNEGMLLKKSHLAAWRINWQAKSDNLTELARELNVGLDSILFLDDNPIECAEVMNRCPDVLTVQLPGHRQAIPMFVKHLWALDRIRITDEDRNRTSMVQAERDRRESHHPETSLADFLLNLKLQVSIRPMTSSERNRTVQLTQRTNQFNSSTIRRSEQEVQSWVSHPDRSCWVVEVRDRFGDYGLTGCLFWYESNQALWIDAFMLSCRVLGKGVEDGVLAAFKALCKERQLSKVMMRFVPTEKNAPFLQFLQRSGWTEEADHYAIPVALLPDAIQHLAIKFNEPLEDIGSHEPNEPNVDRLAEFPTIDPVAAASNIPDSLTAIDWEMETVNELRLRHGNHYVPLEAYTGERLLGLIKSVKTRKEMAQPYVAPETELEATVAKVWSKVLGVSPVGIHDDFFQLGGTSLKAVHLDVEMEQAGFPSDNLLVFDLRTVHLMARHYDRDQPNRMNDPQPQTQEQYPSLTQLEEPMNLQRFDHKFLSCYKGQLISYLQSKGVPIELLLYNSFESTEEIVRQLFEVKIVMKWAYSTSYLIEEEEFSDIGLQMIYKEFSRFQDIEDEFLALIRWGKWLVVSVDHYYLPHSTEMNKRLKPDPNDGHTVIVTGYDPGTGQVTLLDDGHTNYITYRYPLDTLRHANNQLYDEKKYLLYFDFIGKAPDKEKLQRKYRQWIESFKDDAAFYGSLLSHIIDNQNNMAELRRFIDALHIISGSRAIFAKYLQFIGYDSALIEQLQQCSSLADNLVRRIVKFTMSQDIEAEEFQSECERLKQLEKLIIVQLKADPELSKSDYFNHGLVKY
ncbi:HAD-IIIC family phosphatase [Cohnella panacarvi]|uniref:HAD-IIIC family phosphatase n=1 Tax=Cohnella panacarvi TaxID=400776 RepID=UPI000478E93D|nr:HAD-IIIC family phosphatase [Cohnella panacarvi]